MKIAVIPRDRANNDDNLIPMINVVFLLLIFFLIAGSIRASDPVVLESLKTTRQQPLPAPIDLYMDNEGTLYLEGESITIDTLSDKIVERTSEQTDQQSTSLLVLKADSQVQIASMRRLLDSLRDAGIQQIELVTLYTPEKNATHLSL